MNPYHAEYDGYYTMSWHDKEENALKRWFDNYKIDRYASFASETEWLVVKELPSATRLKRRYVCEIGDDGRGTKREAIIDHTAPPAPVLTFAAKRQYVPPPPKTAKELRQEQEWNHMHMMGYEPVYRPKPRQMRVSWNMTAMEQIEAITGIDMDYEIEWVRRRPRYYDQPPVAHNPPPPQHRRNV